MLRRRLEQQLAEASSSGTGTTTTCDELPGKLRRAARSAEEAYGIELSDLHQTRSAAKALRTAAKTLLYDDATQIIREDSAIVVEDEPSAEEEEEVRGERKAAGNGGGSSRG